VSEIVSFSQAAKDQLQVILAGENDPNLKLRVYVEGGGCSGFQYGFTLDEKQNDDDFVIDLGGCTALVDSASASYLNGATVDYTTTLAGSQFTISNPTATTTCGCGSSFSV
jgi:iron-sulfur cluster insertion protein